ncbi:YybH family protein [Yeosuana marina]|uniref:YybH family protein n=1 Tax=Yeosuana marina TaxID=1565536 RepID=UPI0030EC052D|tara:strand:+ start:1621 stop:2118 length:498 start_codon:yes stop_codon:yes gene_type:complete
MVKNNYYTSLAFLGALLVHTFNSTAQNTAVSENDAMKELEYDSLNISQRAIYEVEKAFKNMASKQGIAEAFKHFANKDAVIKREEILIKGKNNIYAYYKQEVYSKAIVLWSPDFIEVADSGDLAYSYGKYVWKIPNAKGEIQEYKGVYLTIWKKQEDNSWRYVWD